VKDAKTEDQRKDVNTLLKQHFLQLTQSFLSPLERYFSSLLPLQKSISIFRRPKLQAFSKIEFLKKIEEKKKKHLELYARFLSSRTFRIWLHARQTEAINKLNALYTRAVAEADLNAILPEKNEVTLIDFYLRLQEQIDLSSRDGDQVTAHFLEEHLRKVFNVIPGDIKISIYSSITNNAKEGSQLIQ